MLGKWDDHAATKLVLAIILIALPDSVNPSLIITELFLAAGPHPRRSTAVFTAAAMATTFAGGLVLAVGLGDVILSLLPKPSVAVKDTVTGASKTGTEATLSFPAPRGTSIVAVVFGHVNPDPQAKDPTIIKRLTFTPAT